MTKHLIVIVALAVLWLTACVTTAGSSGRWLPGSQGPAELWVGQYVAVEGPPMIGGRLLEQEKPPAKAAKVEQVIPPTLSAEAKATLADLRQRLVAIQWMQTLLQREQDLALADLQRTIQALQKPGYTLDWQTGEYRPVK